MSKYGNIRAFEAALKEDEALRKQFAAAQKRIAENREAESDSEVLVKAAAEVGFTLTNEELDRIMAEAQVLNEEELKTVSGAFSVSDEDRFCWVDYYCHYIQWHGDAFGEDNNHACFENFNCIALHFHAS